MKRYKVLSSITRIGPRKKVLKPSAIEPLRAADAHLKLKDFEVFPWLAPLPFAEFRAISTAIESPLMKVFSK